MKNYDITYDVIKGLQGETDSIKDYTKYCYDSLNERLNTEKRNVNEEIYYLRQEISHLQQEMPPLQQEISHLQQELARLTISIRWLLGGLLCAGVSIIALYIHCIS